jgi:hypothetical protein
MSDTVSAKSIWAQMPHGTLTRIIGEPTHKQLKILKKELAANLMAIPCPWGHGKGHLGLLQSGPCSLPSTKWRHICCAHHSAIQVSNQSTCRRPDMRSSLCHQPAKRKAWNIYIIIRTITCNQFAAAINDVYYAILDDPTKGLNAISL